MFLQYRSSSGFFVRAIMPPLVLLKEGGVLLMDRLVVFFFLLLLFELRFFFLRFVVRSECGIKFLDLGVILNGHLFSFAWRVVSGYFKRIYIFYNTVM